MCSYIRIRQLTVFPRLKSPYNKAFLVCIEKIIIYGQKRLDTRLQQHLQYLTIPFKRGTVPTSYGNVPLYWTRPHLLYPPF